MDTRAMSEPPTREQVFVLYAQAMRAAQGLEEALVGFIGARREIAACARAMLTTVDLRADTSRQKVALGGRFAFEDPARFVSIHTK
jgi:hypothetical protein